MGSVSFIGKERKGWGDYTSDAEISTKKYPQAVYA